MSTNCPIQRPRHHAGPSEDRRRGWEATRSRRGHGGLRRAVTARDSGAFNVLILLEESDGRMFSNDDFFGNDHFLDLLL